MAPAPFLEGLVFVYQIANYLFVNFVRDIILKNFKFYLLCVSLETGIS